MILDAALYLATNMAIDGPVANVISTNYIDLGVEKSFGTEPIRMIFKVTQTFDPLAVAPLYEFAIQTADDSAFTTNLNMPCRSGLYGSAIHFGGNHPDAGHTFELIVPAQPLISVTAAQPPVNRYMRAVMFNRATVVATDHLDAGAVDIFIVKDYHDQGRIYPASLGNAT